MHANKTIAANTDRSSAKTRSNIEPNEELKFEDNQPTNTLRHHPQKKSINSRPLTPSIQTLAVDHTHSVKQPTRPSQRAGISETIQRKGVGGTKVAFELGEIDDAHEQQIRDGRKLLLKAWNLARSMRRNGYNKGSKPIAGKLETAQYANTFNEALIDSKKQQKLAALNSEMRKPNVNKESAGYQDAKKAVEGIGLEETDALSGFTVGYSQRLDSIDEEEALLKFAMKQLPKPAEMRGDILKINHDNIEYNLNTRTGGRPNYIKIATLKRGQDAFKEKNEDPQPEDGTKRALYVKHGINLETLNGDPKEYVKDKRGAMTRRYAYVEKNYYQMMEFFMVGNMTGRFQQYMMAGGDRKPGVQKITTDMIRNVPKAPADELSDTQVAVAHQMYGSLPEQRGVSLTSTPKAGVTYANTGGNFRTDDGFKLKIDLARVPEDILFLNHYAQGGVSDMPNADYSTKQTHKATPYNYKYSESALHARELFLEQIKPEWVVEIEHHRLGGFAYRDFPRTTMKEGEHQNLMEAAKSRFGAEEYQKGFEVGLKDSGDILDLRFNSDYKKGKSTGQMVSEGFYKGREVADSKGPSNSATAFKEIMEDESIQDKMSPFHIGYMQGRTGQERLRSALQFQTLLNQDVFEAAESRTLKSYEIFLTSGSTQELTGTYSYTVRNKLSQEIQNQGEVKSSGWISAPKDSEVNLADLMSKDEWIDIDTKTRFGLKGGYTVDFSKRDSVVTYSVHLTSGSGDALSGTYDYTIRSRSEKDILTKGKLGSSTRILAPPNSEIQISPLMEASAWLSIDSNTRGVLRGGYGVDFNVEKLA